MKRDSSSSNWGHGSDGGLDEDFWTDGQADEEQEDLRNLELPRGELLGISTHVDGHPALLLSVEEAARLLGVGRTTVFALICDGRIKTVRLGRRRLVLRAGLDRFVEELSS